MPSCCRRSCIAYIPHMPDVQEVQVSDYLLYIFIHYVVCREGFFSIFGYLKIHLQFRSNTAFIKVHNLHTFTDSKALECETLHLGL